MKKLFLLIISLISLSAKDIPATYQNIIDFQKTGTIIDIRTAEEWEQTGVIPNAKTIAFFDKNGKYNENIFVAKLQNSGINTNKPIALICRSGSRSKKAQEILLEKMKMNVVNLSGGYQNISREHKEGLKENK
jgi:rhodanese-related sulfurtransferase